MSFPLTLRRGYLFLSLLLVGVIAFLWFRYPKVQRPGHVVAAIDTVQTVDTVSCGSLSQSRYRYTDVIAPHAVVAVRHDVASEAVSHSRGGDDLPAADVRRHKKLMVELNTADTLTLQLLHGIGPAFARRIVRYRERLGGFVDKRQLLEVYGFTYERFEPIEAYITLNADSIRRIAINTVSIKQLVKHPYLDPYQARDIIAYRQQGHLYRCPNDLLQVVTMDDTTLSKLAPYLDFSLR